MSSLVTENLARQNNGWKETEEETEQKQEVCSLLLGD